MESTQIDNYAPQAEEVPTEQLGFMKVPGPETHLGRHIVAEFFQANFDALNDSQELEKAMCAAAEVANATVLTAHSHFFEPHGVSSVVIIQESNLCIHTWPEFGYAAADFFTCGDHVNPWKSFEYLKEFLKAEKFNVMDIKRGVVSLINNPAVIDNQIMRPSFESLMENYQDEYEQHTDTRIRIQTQGPPLVNTKSQFQKIVIGQSKFWGKVLWLDDVLTVAEKDEFIYHEMIVHLPMFVHPNPKRVLIIGGGDGAAAREVLKHPDLEKCVMVDIDEVVINMCKKHMPFLSDGAFENPNLDLVIGDAMDYVTNSPDNSFDVIIVDSTDPLTDSPGEILYTEEFYSHVERILAPNGVISTMQVIPGRFDDDIYRRALSALQSQFSKERAWVYLIPTDSWCGQCSLALAFKGESHAKKVDKERIKSFCKGNKLKYYNYDMHYASLCLPTHLRESLGLYDVENESVF